MIQKIFPVIFALLILSVLPAYAAVQVRLSEVHDGDTITVILKSGKREKIRFLGIDAPELRQPYGQQSRKYLASLLKGKQISYGSEGRDQYGRLTATVYVNNENVNLQMVKDGYAWHYKTYSNSKQLAAAQQYARSKKLGLWKDENPTPPWKYRQNERGGKRNEPLIKSPVDNFYFCINLKTFKYMFSKEECPREYIVIIGS